MDLQGESEKYYCAECCGTGKWQWQRGTETDCLLCNGSGRIAEPGPNAIPLPNDLIARRQELHGSNKS